MVRPRRRRLVAVVRLRLLLHAAHPRRSVLVVGDQRLRPTVDVDSLGRRLSSSATDGDDDDNDDDDGDDGEPGEQRQDVDGVGEEGEGTVVFRLQVGRLRGLDGDDNPGKPARSRGSCRSHLSLVSLRAAQPYWTSLSRCSHRPVHPRRSRRAFLALFPRLALFPAFSRSSLQSRGADAPVESPFSPPPPSLPASL